MNSPTPTKGVGKGGYGRVGGLPEISLMAFMAHIFLLLSPIYLLPMIISKGHLCHLDGSDILIKNENDALQSWITIMMVAPADSAAFYKTITATNVSFIIIIIIIILFSPQKSSKYYES